MTQAIARARGIDFRTCHEAVPWLWGMRGTSARQRYFGRCVALLVLVQVKRIPTAAKVVGSSSGEEPWLKARMLEIPVTVPVSTSAGLGLAPTEQHHQNLGVRSSIEVIFVFSFGSRSVVSRTLRVIDYQVCFLSQRMNG